MQRSEIEKISKALSDMTRLKMFEAISSQKKLTCGSLASLEGVTPATVSHHLKILQEAGLIDCRRDGQYVLCVARPERVKEYTSALAKMARGNKCRWRSTQLVGSRGNLK